jgi:hypothetical protein
MLGARNYSRGGCAPQTKNRMPINYYAGKSKEWLIERRDALQDALASSAGGQTRVSLDRGMYDEFAGLKESELQTRLAQVLYALHLLDSETYPNPYTQKVMKATTVLQ